MHTYTFKSSHSVMCFLFTIDTSLSFTEAIGNAEYIGETREDKTRVCDRIRVY